ncbi:MAG: hypothetical protein IJG23_02785, partial [Clostridia bacterium]|nr:hypothetical protein [Clostridia bacterium]
ASRLLFSANLLDFSLIGVSQSASISSKLSRNFLRERCYAVFTSLFFYKDKAKWRRNTFRIARHFNAVFEKKRR